MQTKLRDIPYTPITYQAGTVTMLTRRVSPVLGPTMSHGKSVKTVLSESFNKSFQTERVQPLLRNQLKGDWSTGYHLICQDVWTFKE